MKILNPFKLQNLEYKKFLIVILGIQLSLLGLFGLNKLGVETPILRAVVGFIYISFVPGYLILRILKLNKISSLESFLYSIGISIFFVMLVGFLINILFPYFRITDKPISEIPVIVSISVSVCLLLILSYFSNLKKNNSGNIDLTDIFNPQFLVLTLIPFLSIFGTYLFNNFGDNLLLLILIIMISLIILTFGFTKIINEKYYPYIIWILSVSLILHVSLFSNYIPVNDIIGEYLVSTSVVNNSIWNINDYCSTYSSVLSVTIIPAMIHNICKMSLNWIYKIIFPIYGSIIPVGLYRLYSHYLNKNVSFLAAYIFLSVQPFFMQVILIPKQIFAEIYIILIFLLTTVPLTKNIKILYYIFFVSLVVSHYGTSYLIMAMLLFGALLVKFYSILKKDSEKEYILKGIPVLLYIFILFFWYIYTSKSIVFNAFVHIAHTVYINTITNFLNHNTRGISLLTKPLPTIGLFIKYSYLFTLCIISWGYVSELIKTYMDKSKFSISYMALSSYWFFVLGASVAIPSFAIMGPTRLYNISLILLAPFAILGLNNLIDITKNLLKLQMSQEIKIKTGSILFVSFMLLNTGFISELVKEPTFFKYLNYENAMKYGDLEDKISCIQGIIFTQNIYGGKWLSKYRDTSKNIKRLDVVQSYPSLEIYGNIGDEKIIGLGVRKIPKDIDNNITTLLKTPDMYTQLTYANTKYDLGWVRYNELQQIIPFNISKYHYILHEDFNKIYDTTGSQMYIN